jgi:hypothetical protein
MQLPALQQQQLKRGRFNTAQLQPVLLLLLQLLLLLLQGLGEAAEVLSLLATSKESLLDTQQGRQLLELLDEAEEAILGSTTWDG